VRHLFLDEIEEYPADVDGQGDPESLAERRTDRFARRKIFKCSTPTITGGRIDVAYKASDQRRYFVACPHCYHMQMLAFEQLRWETRKVHETTDIGTGEVSAVEPDAAGAVERDTGELLDVYYECEACKARIDEHVKPELLAAGKWIATNPGPDRAAGFKISALYSPLGWFSWRQIVLKWLAAQRDPSGTKLKTFWNTILGEAYDEAGDSIEPHILKARVEPWRLGGVVPARCLLLTCGVDVQHNRLEAYVWGEGRDRETWLIDRQVIFGSPALEATWQALEDMLAKGYPHAGGQSLRITAMAVDAGDGVTTHFVRVFARKWAYSRRVLAVKGQSVAGKAVIGRPSKQDVNHRGQIIKGGVEVWQYGSDTAKGSLYARLKIEPPKVGDAIDWAAVQAGGIPGYVHLPGGLPDEVFDQLTAEKRVTRYLRGQPRVEWVLERGRRNEALDCAGMADAAAEYAGRSRLNWDRLEQMVNPNQRDLLVEAGKAGSATAPADSTTVPSQEDSGPVPAAVETSGLAAAPRRSRAPAPKRGGFVKNW